MLLPRGTRREMAQDDYNSAYNHAYNERMAGETKPCWCGRSEYWFNGTNDGWYDAGIMLECFSEV